MRADGALGRALLWSARLAIGLMLVVGVVEVRRRMGRSDEQRELKQYVDAELRALQPSEQRVMRCLGELGRVPGLSPSAARALIVGDAVPRLLELRRRAEQIRPRTATVRSLHDEYLAWIEQLLAACRTGVRTLDDPALDGRAGAERVRAAFARADARIAAWQEHVRDAALRQGLVVPSVPVR